MLKSYGLSETPFSPDPLTLNDIELLDNCFAGRSESFGFLTNKLEAGKAVMITGIRSGIGKTSFINYALYKLKDKYFYAIVNTEENWNEETLLYGIIFEIVGLLNKTTAIITFLKKLAKSIPSTILFSMAEYFHVADKFKEVITLDKKSYDPIPDLKKSLKTIIDEIYKLNRKKETIIVFDDLDNMKITSMKKVFKNLKDVFQMRHAHYVFIGKPWTYIALDGIMHDFINMPAINLEDDPLKLDNVIKSVENRINFAKLKGKKVTYPYKDNSVLEKLYDINGGNMRGVLNGLGSALSFAYTKNDNSRIQLNGEEVVNIIENDLKEEMKDLEVGAKVVLEKLANAKNGMLSNGGIHEETGYNGENISKYLGGPLKPYVYIKKIDGKDKFWALEDKIKYFIKLDKTFLD